MTEVRAGTAGFWRLATAHRDAVAIVDDDGSSVTFGELLDNSRRVAHGLRSHGLRRGDCIALVLPNHRSFFEVLLAGLEIGLYVTPVNSHLAGPEIRHVLIDSEAEIVVTHEDLAETIGLAVSGSGLDRDRLYSVGHIDGFRPYDELLADSTDAPAERSAGQQMMYTSGTTGKPKGVRRDLREGDPDDVFGDPAFVTCTGFGIPVGGGTHLVCGPLYHAGPFVGAFNSIHVGKTLVLMRRWTPERFLELVAQHHVDSAQMVPTMFNRLLALPGERRSQADTSSLRSVFHTGAPCPRPVKQAIMDWWGPVVYETYGGTEGAGAIATPKRWLEKPGTVGKPIRGVTIHILDVQGNELPPGQPGDIWIESTAQAPTKYFKDPEKTKTMRRGNWFTLGDIGYVDDDGYLFLCDRKIDMIISGGVNIYPAEVESALLGAAEVADAVVIGVPDPEWGESVMAVVELRDGFAPGPETEASILRQCEEQIARFKLPRSFDFVDHLPRLPNGKVEKRRIRDQYWADQDAAI